MGLLRIQLSTHEYKDYKLEKGTTTIGRKEGNDIVINDLAVSKKHARINREASYFLTDLRSSNGTFINGKKILHSKLSDGDIIHFAGIQATFYT